MREVRLAQGHTHLMRLAQALPTIPYIRLSKIERGEVVARAAELRAIGEALGVPAASLLLDLDDGDFDIADWAVRFRSPDAASPSDERLTVLVAAAVRARRQSGVGLGIIEVGQQFGIAPVTLSRIENAQRPWSSWNPATRDALLELLGVAGSQAVGDYVEVQYRSGALDAVLPLIDGPAEREERTRARITQLREELAEPGLPPSLETQSGGLLPVIGVPGPDGLILDRSSGQSSPAPPGLGPRGFALRMCRPTLGGALPGQAVLFVDPDRFPVAGGLAALRERNGFRVLAVTIDQSGNLTGYSLNPAHRRDFAEMDESDVYAVVAAAYF